jgi:hypothetical protein
MKPTERVLEVDSTLTGERVGMGIDTSALNHIMSVLTDLYSDPELAVIREYSTNALDAHRDAGNPLPIEVTLPTQLAPFFRVRDYGDGLDAEDIRSIYSRYGTSTKRNSDDVVGMLGLGCKSALTYTDQFTLVATKNGRTVQVSVSRDEDGGGSMTIVSDEDTPDAPSGVEVIVPAKRENQFTSKAGDFFRFWSRGSVLVNGEEPEHIATALDGTWLIQDKLLIVKPTGRAYGPQSPGWVVMGNVAYPLPAESSYPAKKFHTVAFVDIGEVNFTPSREALQLTKRTKDTLARIEADVARELNVAMQRRVGTATTPAEALKFAQEANEYGLKNPDLKYQGRDIPEALERPTGQAGTYARPYLVVGDTRYAKKSGESYRKLPPHAEGRIYFTGFLAQDFSKPKRDKLAAWLEQRGEEWPKQIVCVDQLTPDERYWTKGSPVYDWTPIQAIKVARATVGNGYSSRPTGSYEMRLAGTWGSFTADQIPTGQPIVKVFGNRYVARGDRRVEAMPSSVTVVCLPQNRVAKFDRDFPSSVTVRDYVTVAAKAWEATVDPAALEAAWYQISTRGSRLTGLDPARIDDPELARCVRLQNFTPSVKGALSTHHELLTAPTGLPSGDPFSQYPLLHGSYSMPQHKEHTYLYVNAAYAATSRQGETE